MDFPQALEVVNAVVSVKFNRHLSDVETAILSGAWYHQTYDQIAKTSGYSTSYLTRDVGPKLWKLLAEAIGESVSKTNFQTAIERQWQLLSKGDKEDQEETEKSSITCQTIQNPKSKIQNQTDWGEAVDVSLFYGRTEELATLEGWIQRDRCRAIAILGMGGIGKTSLAVKLAQQIQADFEIVIWRSLRYAPPLKTLLGELVSFVSAQQETEAKLERFMYWLRRARCLLILDNTETILQAGNNAGQYRPGYEEYGELFKTIGETAHQSCLILTSREKPAEIAAAEGCELAVRSLRLSGSPEVSHALMQARGLSGSDEQKQRLCHLYGCNPLALKIVSTSIRDLFDGDIGEFLAQDVAVFNGIHKLLEQQCDRCSPLEKTILAWLAINREWTSISELAADIVPTVSRAELLAALESLSWRSLIEKQAGSYTQQPVVMEYITDRLVKQVCQEILTLQILFLNSHALLKAQGKEYIRDTQIDQIIKPILDSLTATLGCKKNVENQLAQVLSKLQTESPCIPGYAGGNLLNLLSQLQTDLTNYDFSHLTLWQADLRDVNLHRVNFSDCDLSKSVFAATFALPLAVKFSPDGQLLATGDGDGKVRLWRVADGTNLLTCKGHTSWVWSVAFSPDGKMLASGSDDRTVRLWDVETGHCRKTLRGHTCQIWSVAFSPDSQTLASGSEDRTIKLWDLETGNCGQILQGHENWVRSVTFSPDGKFLASGSDDETVKLWDLETGQCYQTLLGHTSRIWSVALSPDGQILASGSSDRTVKIWHLSTGECLYTLQGHGNWVRSLTFSPNGQLLASGSEDQTIRLWDVHTGHCCQTLKGHGNWVRSVDFSPDGEILASGSGDHTVKFWHVRSGRCNKTLQGYTNRVWFVAFGLKEGCRVWGVGCSEEEQRLASGKEQGIRGILASGHDDCTVKLWDLSSGQCYQTLRGHTNAVCSAAFSPDGQTLASGSCDQTIKLWDINTGRCRKSLSGHSSRIWSVAFSPDGRILASGSDDQTVKLWDVQTGQCRQTLLGHENWVCSVAFSPVSDAADENNPPLLASGSYDQTAKLWDLTTGECYRTLHGHTNWVWCVAFSSDGQILASGSGDNTVKLWNVQTGECDRTLPGHRSRIWSVAFSPDGQTLATGSSDKTVKLWDLQTGKCRQTLRGHDNLVWSVAFSPDGRILASGSQDETIVLWDMKTGRCLKTLKADRPYESLNLTGVRGLTEAQLVSLMVLGAIAHS
jgi:WD40 repeat protein